MKTIERPGIFLAQLAGNAAPQAWAVEELLKAASASRQLGLALHATFSGALAWSCAYPWQPRPAGRIEMAFRVLHQSAGRGARDGAAFIRHIITVTGKAFENCAADGSDVDAHRPMLGIA
jgi:hypothetical protein